MPSFAHTAYVSPTGNDLTAQLDSQTLKFATAQGAYNAVYAAWSGNTGSYYLLSFADGNATNYGSITASADWPSYIWIQGDGRDTTSIGGIIGVDGSPHAGYGDDGVSLNINSDGSIKVASLQGGNGATAYPSEDPDNYNGYGGNGGNITSHNLYISGNVYGGSGGSVGNDVGQAFGGNAGNVNLVNCYCQNAIGGNGGDANGNGNSWASYGGNVTITGVLSGASYENSSFYGGNTGIVGSNPFGGASSGGVNVSNCTFNSCYSGFPNDDSQYPADVGNIIISNCTAVNVIASNGCSCSDYFGGTGGSITISNSTITNVVQGGNGGASTNGNGGSGGSVSFTNSHCGGWIYAGNGNLAYGAITNGGNGGNITIVNSTFPNGLYGGIAGGNFYNSDPYIIGFGSFGYVSVNGVSSFSYPATQAVTYRNWLENTTSWDVYVNWQDADDNLASYFPNSSTDINVYDSILFSTATSQPISVNNVSAHNNARLSVSFNSNSVTFRDNSGPESANILGTFQANCTVNFYDNSTIYNSNAFSNPIAPVAKFYTNTALTNVINALILANANFTAYEYACSSSGGGNSGQISRLIGLPWFINI